MLVCEGIATDVDVGFGKCSISVIYHISDKSEMQSLDKRHCSVYDF